MSDINEPRALITHENFGRSTRFSFELDSPHFSQNYLVAILGHAAREIAERWAAENYDAIAKQIDRERIVDAVVVQAAKAITKKWSED